MTDRYLFRGKREKDEQWEFSWYGANGITAIKQWLRKNGWSVGKEKILCPHCRRKSKGAVTK